MPNTSQNRRQMVADYRLFISLPNNAFVKGFQANYVGGYWIISVVTTKDQSATLKARDGHPLHFSSLDSVAGFLADQGALEMNVSLLKLSNQTEGAA
ncbi:hypothetical protein AVO42_11035 [Thiomicrospira sp. XS5]|uniref:hypothetical protein n=1 Tax=Thiomicrospira sp. XS5 TaxID=1775636 RepID=UPI000749C0DA|nr:hypothetical protein [Thiomicrospira sp. XS5]KUJ75806.1 hypothetical protein AVO42_11035 [Thiomicrospira sp. XS5]